jgi:hypothetical protein
MNDESGRLAIKKVLASHFPFVFDLLPLALLVVDLGVLLVSPDLVIGGVAAAGGVIGGVADDEEGEAGVAEFDSVGFVPMGGVPVAGVVEPSAAGVVDGGSGFLNGSSQVCRT